MARYRGAKAARALLGIEIVGWKELPDWSHGLPMDVPNLREVDQRAIRAPVSRRSTLLVHPSRSAAVRLDLEILSELLVSDRSPLVKQHLHLFEHQGVALDRS
jgi:hypothetical protein